MIGKIIQNYRIVSKIGEGGMGIVYLGEHTAIRRKAAIKFLNPVFLQNDILREKFINEAQTLAELQHTNIVLLYDLGTYESNIFLLMEYLEGISLDKIIARDKPNLEEHIVKNILFGVLNGVSYAHKKKIVHRDLKPSNILISKDGVPKILDFGIAKILTSEAQITGVRMGSVTYMSPEQVLHKTIDERTDVYSLGVTLYEMLTNMNPYRDVPSEFLIYDKIVKEDFPSPRLINPSISEHIESILLKATEKRPEDRFQSCDEFIIALYDSNFRYRRKINYDISSVNTIFQAEQKTEHIFSPRGTESADLISNDIQKEPAIISQDSELSETVSTEHKEDSKNVISKIQNPYNNHKNAVTETEGIPSQNIRKKKKTWLFPVITIFIIIMLVVLLLFLQNNYFGEKSVNQESENTDTSKNEAVIENKKIDTLINTSDSTDMPGDKTEENRIPDETSKTSKNQKKVTTKQQKTKTIPQTIKKQETNQDKNKPRVRFE